MTAGLRFRRDALLWACVCSLLVSAPALGQEPVLFTTIRGAASSATRVNSKMTAAAVNQKWTVSPADCKKDNLADLLKRSSAVAVLTTADCLASSAVAELSASLGVPAFFYGETGTVPKVGLKSNVRIGMLSSARNRYEFSVLWTLRALGVTHVDLRFDDTDYVKLVGKLALGGAKGGYDYICVIDDGSGTAPGEVAAAARTRATITLIAPIELASGQLQVIGADTQEASPSIRPVVVQARFVKSPFSDEADASVLVFPTSPATASRLATQQKPILTSVVDGVLRLFGGEPVTAADEPESRSALPAVIPVLLGNSVMPAEMRETLNRSLLTAPVDAAINPCDSTSQDAYRSFLRGAAAAAAPPGPAEVALWEHAALQKSRRDPDPYYDSQFLHTSERVSEATRTQIIDAFEREFKGNAPASCKPPRRWSFSSDPAAAFQYGVKRLRDALAEPNREKRLNALENAAACLKAALPAPDRPPSCGIKLNGLWTTYYAPYITAAVLTLEGHDVHK